MCLLGIWGLGSQRLFGSCLNSMFYQSVIECPKDVINDVPKWLKFSTSTNDKINPSTIIMGHLITLSLSWRRANQTEIMDDNNSTSFVWCHLLWSRKSSWGGKSFIAHDNGSVPLRVGSFRSDRYFSHFSTDNRIVDSGNSTSSNFLIFLCPIELIELIWKIIGACLCTKGVILGVQLAQQALWPNW